MTLAALTPRVVVLGAGSVGSYLGGSLHAGGGCTVTLIGRERMRQQLCTHGIRLSDLHGGEMAVPAEAVDYRCSPEALADSALILVTVKSGDTWSAAEALREHAPPDVPIISFQNGIGNVNLLRSMLPGRRVLAGMVPFNIVQLGQGRLHRGTEGKLYCDMDDCLTPWRAAFDRANLPLFEHARMPAVQWGKLLLNLNNAINALSGVPLKSQLQQRDYRLVLAACTREALHVLRHAGIQPLGTGRIPLRWMPLILDLPDPLFSRIAGRMLAIDAQARSSMADDLQAGRLTEVDTLNGEVVALAKRAGTTAPCNALMVSLIHEAERCPDRQNWDAAALLERLLTVRQRQLAATPLR